MISVEGEPFCQICWETYTLEFKKRLEEQCEIASTIPWHRRHEIGPFKAFIETASQVVFEPAIFFSHLPASKDMKTPLLFAIICVLFIWFPLYVFHVKILYPPILDLVQSVSVLEEESAETSEIGRQSAEMSQELRTQFESITNLQLAIMPVFFIAWYVLIASVLQQFLVQIFRGREGYSATLEIRCYTMVLHCLWLIPFVGVILTEIISIFICTRGFQVVQKLTFPQALCVSLIPVVVLYLLPI
jgi:hypothetical protein